MRTFHDCSRNAVGNLISVKHMPCAPPEYCRLVGLSQRRVEAVKGYFEKWGCKNTFVAKGWGCLHEEHKAVKLVRINPV